MICKSYEKYSNMSGAKYSVEEIEGPRDGENEVSPYIQDGYVVGGTVYTDDPDDYPGLGWIL